MWVGCHVLRGKKFLGTWCLVWPNGSMHLVDVVESHRLGGGEFRGVDMMEETTLANGYKCIGLRLR